MKPFSYFICCPLLYQKKSNNNITETSKAVMAEPETKPSEDLVSSKQKSRYQTMSSSDEQRTAPETSVNATKDSCCLWACRR